MGTEFEVATQAVVVVIVVVVVVVVVKLYM